MKKIILMTLISASLGLVGCSAQKYPDKTAERDNVISSANHRPKCKAGKNCMGKLGVEKMEQDTYK